MTTLQDSRIESIEHLDFVPRCVCEMEDCCHPGGVECGAEAVVIVAVHAIDECNGDNVDVNGDEVGPMCAACLDRVTALTVAWTERVRNALRSGRHYVACDTCGAPMMHVSDVIRDVRPIR